MEIKCPNCGCTAAKIIIEESGGGENSSILSVLVGGNSGGVRGVVLVQPAKDLGDKAPEK